MAPRLPGTTKRATKPPREAAWTTPTVRCPSGKRRYQSEDTAAAHYRVSRGASVVVACAMCGGWHHARRPAGPAPGAVLRYSESHIMETGGMDNPRERAVRFVVVEPCPPRCPMCLRGCIPVVDARGTRSHIHPTNADVVP